MNATTETNIYKPILFSTEMVQANLENRKNQTRRICKVDALAKLIGLYAKRRLWDRNIEECPNPLGHFAKFELDGVEMEVKSKFTVGDILWVRETFQESECFDFQIKNQFVYKANEADFNFATEHNVNWKPSLFMPKEAARIFLKVTNVRCERLQDISEEDAIAEGAKDSLNRDDMKLLSNLDWVIKRPFGNHQFGFLALWQSINAKKHPWESNPWVWVYEFEKIEKPENFI